MRIFDRNGAECHAVRRSIWILPQPCRHAGEYLIRHATPRDVVYLPRPGERDGDSSGLSLIEFSISIRIEYAEMYGESQRCDEVVSMRQ